jgi:hypothetical protein
MTCVTGDGLLQPLHCVFTRHSRPLRPFCSARTGPRQFLTAPGLESALQHTCSRQREPTLPRWSAESRLSAAVSTSEPATVPLVSEGSPILRPASCPSQKNHRTIWPVWVRLRRRQGCSRFCATPTLLLRLRLRCWGRRLRRRSPGSRYWRSWRASSTRTSARTSWPAAL